MASNELVLRLPHTLGAVEAKRRIAVGAESAKSRFRHYISLADLDWIDNRLDFRVVALRQTVSGSVDVQDDYVELRTTLPTLIRLLANRFVPIIEQNGQKLLK